MRDGGDVVLFQGVEHHHLVDAVDELRAQRLAHHVHHRVLDVLVEALGGEGLHGVGAEVGGHHQHGVAEVHGAAVAVGEAAVLQHLQEDVEHVRVGFLDFVEQNQGVRSAAHPLGELAALLVADVARRGADQARHRVLFHVFGHVHPHQRVFAVEQRFGQRPAQLRFADAGGAEEQEAAVRALRIREAGAGAAHRLGHRRHRLVLADHAGVQVFLQAQQFLAFAAEQLGHRHARPLGDDLRHFRIGDAVAQQHRVAIARRGRVAQLAFQSRNAPVLQFRHLGQVAGPARRLELQARRVQGFLDLLRALHAGLLRRPDLVQIGVFLLQAGDGLLEVLPPLGGGLVGFALQRFEFDFALDELPL